MAAKQIPPKPVNGTKPHRKHQNAYIQIHLFEIPHYSRCDALPGYSIGTILGTGRSQDVLGA